MPIGKQRKYRHQQLKIIHAEEINPPQDPAPVIYKLITNWSHPMADKAAAYKYAKDQKIFETIGVAQEVCPKIGTTSLNLTGRLCYLGTSIEVPSFEEYW